MKVFEFFNDCEELEAWIYERRLRLQTAGLGQDLNHVQLAQHKHKVTAESEHRGTGLVTVETRPSSKQVLKVDVQKRKRTK